MAVVYVSEYHRLADGAVQAGQEPSIAEQQVAIGGGSLQTDAFNAATSFIRVHTDAICHIAIGKNPTAAATTKRLAANQTEFFGVNAGDKVAVITGT